MAVETKGGGGGGYAYDRAEERDVYATRMFFGNVEGGEPLG
jgi:hypothetical protein